MWWIFTLGAALLWATANIIDKHVVSDELKDPVLCTVTFGITMFILFGIFTLVMKPSISLQTAIIIFSVLAGMVMSFGVIFYFKALAKEEVSRVIPMLALTPLVVLLFATFLFDEKFSFVKICRNFFFGSWCFLNFY